jgi:hypothetical protein
VLVSARERIRMKKLKQSDDQKGNKLKERVEDIKHRQLSTHLACVS